MRNLLLVLTPLAVLLGGGSMLWSLVSRPVASPGELRVLDEQPLALGLDFSGTETATLLTVVDPAADFDMILPPALPNGVTVGGALAFASNAKPNALVTEIQLRRDRGLMVYRVDFDDGARMLIDAGSGQVLEIAPRGRNNDERSGLGQGVSSQVEMLEAIALAVERYPGTTFEEAELDEHDGRLVYVIELDNALEVTIDANTGAYHYTELNGERWVGEQPVIDTASVSSEVALQTAQNLFPAATVEEWELTVEDGRLVYDVELDNGNAVYVDADTGGVVEIEREE